VYFVRSAYKGQFDSMVPVEWKKLCSHISRAFLVLSS